MRIKFWKSLFALPLLAASCGEQPVTEPTPVRTISVSVGSEPKVSIGVESTGPKSRTELGDDGKSVKWSTNDQIAIWAINSGGTAQLDAQPFRLWHYNTSYGDAKFTADIAPMPEDTYTYCAVYPLPESRSGTQASYTIPATQNGAYNSKYNVMTATTRQGAALQSGDNSEVINFAFSHKVHILKITVPTNKLGAKVSTIELTFPSAVTGTLTVDASNPNAAPQLAGGSNVLTLNLAQPVDAGATVYAFIAPVEFTSAQSIKLMAYTATRESYETYMAGKKFEAGHTTPIKYNVPLPEFIYTILDINMLNTGETTLGEKVNTLTFSAPAGVVLDNGSNVRAFSLGQSGIYRMKINNFNNNLSNQTVTLTYDSNNALITRTIQMPQIYTDAVNTIATLSVPYLFEEDFSGAGDFSGGEEANSTSTGKEMTSANLAGWYAYSRAQITAGTSATLRSYSNLFGPFHSGMRSCLLTNIKSGKTVTVKVAFNGNWVQNVSSSMGLIVGRTTGNKLNSAIDASTTLALESNAGASSTDIPTLCSVNVSGFTSAQAIAWKTSGKNGSVLQYFNYDNIYIDNIKVSIAQ